MAKAKVWYGDVANRRCGDCGERADWDERLRLGYVALGGPTHQDGITPLYDAERRYGNTPEGRAAQDKLMAHSERFHRGGLVTSLPLRDGWRIDVVRHDAGMAAGRAMLKAKRPFFGIFTITRPDGATSTSYTRDSYKTVGALFEACVPDYMKIAQNVA